MSFIVSNIKMPIEADVEDISDLLTQQFGIPSNGIKGVRLVRSSLDARRKQDIHFNVTALVQVTEPVKKKLLARKDARIQLHEEEKERSIPHGKESPQGRIVVVGMGPAGLFAGYLLAKEGYRPLVIERGEPVEKRAATVDRFWNEGTLNEESNVMFGEGGAGAFSDGKLTTRIKDFRANDVLRALVQFGAPMETAYQAKPHVGTDILRVVVTNMRKEILRLGGEIYFNTRLVDLEEKEGRIVTIHVRKEGDREEKIPCCACVLATGQGARDVYYMLDRRGQQLAPKPFAVGVRIEHPQELVNRAQFGKLAGDPRLGAAEYRLSTRSDDRGVYTFCMCPGGRVIASSSEKNEVVVNGMSYHARNGRNANAAIVVQVSPGDFGTGAFDGIRFQQQLEQKAFQAIGDYIAPAERVVDYLSDAKPAAFGGVIPTYKPGVAPYRLKKCLPDFVAAGIGAAIKDFSTKLKGFALDEAVLTAVESRTSAPVRILRNEQGEAPGMKGLFPVGEGAGYAGGIVSAAVDGMKAAERIIGIYAAEKV